MAKEKSSAASGSPHSSSSMWKSHFILLRGHQPVREEGGGREVGVGVESEVSGGRRSYGRSPSPPRIPVLSDGAQTMCCRRGVTDVASHGEFRIFLCR